VLSGATASGKTELAIELARRFGAEIVGADSRQIYRGMTIGTAAPTAAQRAAVPHHLIEIVDPRERYSAARFSREAVERIRAIHGRGRRAIVAGGTGFYIRALTGGVSLAAPAEADIRRRLSREAQMHEPAFLHAWLSIRHPARAAVIASEDRYRVLRALEIVLMNQENGRPDSPPVSLPSAGIPSVKLFIDVDEALLGERIGLRVDSMLAAGLLEEAERVGPEAVAASAVGYPQALAHLRGWSTRKELRATFVRATRRYAKRQRTWFRTEPHVVWLSGQDLLAQIDTLAKEKLGWA